MFADLALFKTSGQMAEHAGLRQSVIAKNIANSDVPGYKALDIPKFEVSQRRRPMAEPISTRSSHLPPTFSIFSDPERKDIGPIGDPNGNTVSLETELMKSAETKLHHDMALRVYSSGLTILRTTLGRG